MTLHALIFNPASGRGRGAATARRVAELFERQGNAVRLMPTERAGHAADLVEALLRERDGDALDVLALGGDGTLNEALLGAFRAGALDGGHAAMRLAALPGGTTNVVARSLGLPRNPLAAAEALLGGHERRLDVGTCRLHAQKRPFLLACGAGFDAEILQRVTPSMKRWLGEEAYRVAALTGTGERGRRIAAEIELADGRREHMACESVIVGASELYAGSLRISPDAQPDDGLLEVALLSSTRFLPLARAAWHAMRTSLSDAPGVRVMKARVVRLSAPLLEVPVHVDAEPFGLLPCEIGVLPQALRMRVP